ncbi:MAG: hypothetical protein M1820_002239 [Bogoriella megaspora]|nr:MAG: hypothetical protein M1820_002239 [Bogoriella megaspora]
MTGVHGQVLGHVVRRSVEAVQNQNDDMQTFLSQHQLPTWAVVSLVLYCLVFAILLASIRYTIGDVIATLMMVETPKTETVIFTESKESSDPDAPLEKAPLLDAEAITVKHEAVTRTARSTMCHMVKKAGFFSRWRGLSVSFVYHLCVGILLSFVPPRSPLLQGSVSIIATVLFSRLHMTWTHVLISEPSTKGWWRRIPSAKAGHNVLLPSAIYATAQQLTIYMPVLLALVLGVHNVDHSQLVHSFDKAERVTYGLKLFACAVTGLFVAVMILLPAAVTLTRVEASMLPEEDEAIVPFDRTFGGKAESTVTDRSGSISFVEAWRSCDKIVRFRIVKVYAQLITMQVVIMILGITGAVVFISGYAVAKNSPN